MFDWFDVKIVYYLRRQDHLLESVYAQKSKSHFSGEFSDVSFPLGLVPTLKAATDAFGPENVVIRPYEKASWRKGDIAADILHHLFGIDTEDYTSVACENVSLHRRMTMFLASLDVERAIKLKVVAAIAKSDSIVDDGQRYCSSPAYRKQVYDGLRESNSDFLRPFGINDADAFLGYSEDQDGEGWFAPEPLSKTEQDEIRECLARAGLDADAILSARRRSVF